MYYKVDFSTEVCCDYCNEIYAMYFNCPVCHEKKAEIDCGHDFVISDGKIFECKNCETKFKVMGLDKKSFSWIINVL